MTLHLSRPRRERSRARGWSRPHRGEGHKQLFSDASRLPSRSELPPALAPSAGVAALVIALRFKREAAMMQTNREGVRSGALASFASLGRSLGRRKLGSRDLVEWLDPPADFNFSHFRMRHMLAELLRTHHRSGIPPGGEAPPFDLETTAGTRLHLLDLRGRPVLIHFVSYTCPVTRGSVAPMKELHRRFGDRVQFVDILVRQAHPGERRGAYHSFAEKMADAGRYQRDEAISWPVAVDDLAGTIQHAYGGMSASIYLLDAHGRVAFYAMWGQAPALTGAIEQLLARGGVGAPVGGGIDGSPHLGAAIVAGQGGPARGGLMSFVDLELGFPGAPFLMLLGRLARPVLAPLVQRTTPWCALRDP